MSSATAAVTIGVLARRTGCPIQTIRYYETIGLLPKPPRSAGGHRVYGESHATRLAVIMKARALDLPLKEVRRLVGLAERAVPACAEAKDLAEMHLREITKRIADLRALQRTLAAYVADCSAKCGTRVVPECGIAAGLLRG